MIGPVNNITAPTTPSAQRSGPGRRRLLGRKALIPVAALVLCMAGTVSGWAVLGHRAADGMKVTWNSVGCNTPKVSVPSPDEGTMFEARPGMHCEIWVSITSKHPVRLTRMVANYLGPGSGVGIQVGPDAPGWNTQSAASVAAGSTMDCQRLRRLRLAVDAVRSIDVEVSDTSPYTVKIPVVYRACANCPPEGVIGVIGMPEVEFTTWGRTYTRAADETFTVQYPDGPDLRPCDRH